MEMTNEMKERLLGNDDGAEAWIEVAVRLLGDFKSGDVVEMTIRMTDDYLEKMVILKLGPKGTVCR